jgi:hypothetical protein
LSLAIPADKSDAHLFDVPLTRIGPMSMPQLRFHQSTTDKSWMAWPERWSCNPSVLQVRAYPPGDPRPLRSSYARREIPNGADAQNGRLLPRIHLNPLYFAGENQGCKARRCTGGLHPMRETMWEGALSTNNTPFRIHDTTSCSQKVICPPRHATVCSHVKDSQIGCSCFRSLAPSSAGWSLNIRQLLGCHSALPASPSAGLPAVD